MSALLGEWKKRSVTVRSPRLCARRRSRTPKNDRFGAFGCDAVHSQRDVLSQLRLWCNLRRTFLFSCFKLRNHDLRTEIRDAGDNHWV